VTQLAEMPSKLAMLVPLVLVGMGLLVVAILSVVLIGLTVFAKDDRRSRRLREIIQTIGAAVADARGHRAAPTRTTGPAQRRRQNLRSRSTSRSTSKRLMP